MQSYCTIPLTERAFEILKTVESNRYNRKESELLGQVLYYIRSAYR